MKPFQVTQAFLLCCPTETGKCSLRRGDCATRIFLVSQRGPANHLPVRRFDDVHDRAAMRLNERSINVVRRNCLDCVFLCDGRHRVSPYANIHGQNEGTRRLYEPSGNIAQPPSSRAARLFWNHGRSDLFDLPGAAPSTSGGRVRSLGEPIVAPREFSRAHRSSYCLECMPNSTPGYGRSVLSDCMAST